jgi:hypothetical protein
MRLDGPTSSAEPAAAAGATVDRFDSTSWCLLEPDISVGWAAGGLVAPSGGASGAARAAPSASPAGGGAAPDGEVGSRQARRLKPCLKVAGIQFYGASEPLPVAAAVFRREVLVHRDHWRTPECIAVLQSLHPRVGRWSPIGSLGEDNLRHILELTFSTPQRRTSAPPGPTNEFLKTTASASSCL